MSYDFADCASLGHFWERVDKQRSAAGTATIVYQCGRCEKRRFDTYNVRGLYIISRRYEHPPGFKPREDHQHSRSEWREIYLTRILKRKR